MHRRRGLCVCVCVEGHSLSGAAAGGRRLLANSTFGGRTAQELLQQGTRVKRHARGNEALLLKQQQGRNEACRPVR